MNCGVIYCAISPSGKKYYGKTTKLLEERIIGHEKYSLKSNCHFSLAIRKYGIQKFIWEVTEILYDESKQNLRNNLNKRERHWIRKNKTNYREFGYNMTNGGDGGGVFGRKLSEETKRKISQSLIGRKYSEERKEKMSRNGKGVSRNKGRKLSDETKRKISVTQKGRKLSEETCKKMSNSRKGKPRPDLKGKTPWNKGIPMSKEAKEKMINSSKGVSRNKGRKLSEETTRKTNESF